MVCLLFFLTTIGFAADVNLVVNTDQVIHRVDPMVYGHFLEHIYNSCNGGLWGELIWNRSFEGGGFKGIPAPWPAASSTC